MFNQLHKYPEAKALKAALPMLKQRCLAKDDTFFTPRPGWQIVNADNPKTRHAFKAHSNGNAKLLAVAHIDTVRSGYTSKAPHFYNLKLENEQVIFSLQLDDRLGAWLILDVLPNIPGWPAYDVLLTDREETAQSTAFNFVPSKQYNWAFQFDRRGVGDAALYKYFDNDAWCMAVRRCGYLKPVPGSYTCIEDLQIGACAVNFSVGYQGEHSPMCHARLYDVLRCVYAAQNFTLANADTHFAFADVADANVIDADVALCLLCKQAVDVFDIDEDGVCVSCNNQFFHPR